MNDKKTLSFIITGLNYSSCAYPTPETVHGILYANHINKKASFMFYIPEAINSSLKHPGPLMTSEPGSFAYNTFKVRIPLIIDEIVAHNQFAPEVVSSMRTLREEISNGKIKPIAEQTIDQMFWNGVSERWIGKSWLEAPWYWAESYFYRRVLEATKYFQPGARYHLDPYLPQKMAELSSDAALHVLTQKLTALPSDLSSRLKVLLHNCLWGNRTDLSYNVANALGASASAADESANVLIDDTSKVIDKLVSQDCRQLAVITDNAGTELLMDLALINDVLSNGLVERVVMLLKEQPFFVSDAMPDDVLSSVTTLQNSPEPLRSLGARLNHLIAAGKLVLTSHWFFTTCLYYTQMPADLRSSLAESKLVVIKGDANYRRLLSDAHWAPTASFTGATDYFPAPFVALRTCKAELITGLSSGMAEHLDILDRYWRVNGKRGVIQSNLTL